MKVHWTNHALKQLDSVYNYIATDSEIYAQKFVDKITQSTQILSVFPTFGRIVPELNTDNIRELVQKNYRIVYIIKTTKIDILSILHTKQSFYL